MSNLTLAIQNQKLRFWNGNLIGLKGRNRSLPILSSKTKRLVQDFFHCNPLKLPPQKSRQRIDYQENYLSCFSFNLNEEMDLSVLRAEELRLGKVQRLIIQPVRGWVGTRTNIFASNSCLFFSLEDSCFWLCKIL